MTKRNLRVLAITLILLVSLAILNIGQQATFFYKFDPTGLSKPLAVQTKIGDLLDGLILRELPNAQLFVPTVYSKIVSETETGKFIVHTLIIRVERNSERGESYFIKSEVDTAGGTSKLLEKVPGGEMDKRAAELPGNALSGWELKRLVAADLTLMENTFQQKETLQLSRIAVAATLAFQPESAYAAVFVPLSQQNPPAGTTGTDIKNWLVAKGKNTHLFLAPNATADKAWPYIKNGKRLYVLYYCCHGDTGPSDGQPCNGTIMSGSEMFWYQYRDVSPYTGLLSCVVYICGCNTFINPLNDGITKPAHHVRTYIASQKLVPMAKSPIFNRKFWDKVINQSKTMSTAMAEAANETPLLNYFLLEGNSGRPVGL